MSARIAVDAEDLRTVLSQRDMHAHRAPGYWDADGTACRECAARTRLKEALYAPPDAAEAERDDLAQRYQRLLAEADRLNGRWLDDRAELDRVKTDLDGAWKELLALKARLRDCDACGHAIDEHVAYCHTVIGPQMSKLRGAVHEMEHEVFRRRVERDRALAQVGWIVARDGGRDCEVCGREIRRGEAYELRGVDELAHIHCPNPITEEQP